MTTEKNLTITIWKSGFSVPEIAGEVYSRNKSYYRGEVVTLTPELIEMTVDRKGNSWLDLTEENQREKWGEVRFRHGDHSAEVKFIGDDDSTVIFRRRENETLAARKIVDPAERAAALKRIHDLYGPVDSGQRTLRVY